METLHEFAFMFGFMLFAAGFHFVRVRSAQASWREAALKLGLNYKGGGLFVRPHVFGVVQGVPVLARIEDRGSGKSRRPFTVVRADVGGAEGLTVT